MYYIVAVAGKYCFMAFAQIATSHEKPNVIFSLADELSYGDIGCYGAKN